MDPARARAYHLQRPVLRLRGHHQAPQTNNLLSIVLWLLSRRPRPPLASWVRARDRPAGDEQWSIKNEAAVEMGELLVCDDDDSQR